jgi:truncated hemoglobin YjbI
MVTATQPSLIEKMGGIAAASGVLISAVEIFYAKLVGDPRLAPFFVDVDIEKLKKKQVEFLAYVFGGPSAYTGKDLYAAHEHLIRDQGEHELRLNVATITLFPGLHLTIVVFIRQRASCCRPFLTSHLSAAQPSTPFP